MKANVASAARRSREAGDLVLDLFAHHIQWYPPGLTPEQKAALPLVSEVVEERPSQYAWGRIVIHLTLAGVKYTFRVSQYRRFELYRGEQLVLAMRVEPDFEDLEAPLSWRRDDSAGDPIQAFVPGSWLDHFASLAEQVGASSRVAA